MTEPGIEFRNSDSGWLCLNFLLVWDIILISKSGVNLWVATCNQGILFWLKSFKKDCWEDVETNLFWQPFSTKFLNAYVKRKWDYDFPWKLFGSLSDMDICYLKFCGTICVNVINTPPQYVLTFLYSSGVVSFCR